MRWAWICLLLAGLDAAPRYGVFLSGDRGKSWARADSGLPDGARVNALGAIGGSLLAGTDAGLFVSRDRGMSWEAASGARGRVLSLATLGQEVYAGTRRSGVWVSLDEGRSWTRDLAYSGQSAVRSLAALGGKLYAGTDTEGVFVKESAWRAVGEGLPAKAQVFSLAGFRGRMYAGLYAKGLFVWDGRVWRREGMVTPLALSAGGETLMAGHNPGGIFWSGDGAGKWTQAGGLAGRAAVWEMGAGDGLSLAGVEDGIFISEDGGRRWQRARMPVAGPGISFFVSRELVLVGVQLEGPK